MTALQITFLAVAAIAATGALALRFVATAKEVDSEFGVLDDESTGP